MNTFPNKLPSRMQQHAQSLKILSEFESTKTHVEFCWSNAVSFPIKVMVVLFVDDMMRCFAFLKRAVTLDRRASECNFSFVINYVIGNEF